MTIENNIPGYDISEILHKGNKIIVYKATSNTNHQKVLLKAHLIDQPGPGQTAMLTKEYDTLKNIDIPGVNKVNELLTFENRAVLVMEDLGGLSLSEYMKQYEIDLADFLEIAIKIAEILGKIHAKNIMHKNINPNNIIINPITKEVSIIDFGISAKLSRERTFANNPNVIEGSLAYMSPEQTGRMNRVTDYRTDLYSLGITFYEMLIGDLPYKAEDPLELVYCHIAKRIPPLTDIKLDIPPMLSDIVLKLTAKIAEDRYQSATGLKADLEECLRRLKETGSIPYFPLSQKDVFSKFMIPEKLYGREKEIKELISCFEEAARGNNKLMLITGAAGIGKTALVNEIHKPSVQTKGYFISGKFDQFKTNIPFSAFRQAFSNLLRYLVSEPKDKIESIKQKLIEALGMNASTLTAIIPEFELIIGKQNAASVLNPSESQNRFFFTLRDFIQVFATSDHPLTIFLDDLQWCDDTSLSLLKELVLKEIPYLFIIGAYRKNELTNGHPFGLAVEEIKKKKTIYEATLNPLNQEHVNKLIADAMLSDLNETNVLSTLIYKRTGGNPFYINELLKNIYRDGLVNFDYANSKWTWDIEKIAKLNVSENVVHFMTDRLKELPVECLEAIKLAACVGNIFTLKTLSFLTGKTASEVAVFLWPALEKEVIIPLNEDYRLVTDNQDFDVSYKFFHDRIQQAAYTLIDEENRKAVNLKIGRDLYQKASDLEREGMLIELVRYYNEGRSLISESNEKILLAEMNAQAGLRAQASVAYNSALQYYKTGIELLPVTMWQAHYDIAYKLHKGYAENAYQTNDYNTADEVIDLLLSHAKTDLEKVEILSIRLRQYSTVGKAEEAIKTGIEGLKLLGYYLPESPGPLLLLKEVITAKLNLKKRKPVDLLNSPVLANPKKKAVARLLSDIAPSAFVLGKDNLFGLTQLKIVNLSLLHGNCAESAYAFITFGTVLSSVFGDLKLAESFGRLALSLIENLNDIEYRCRVIAAYGVLTHHINNHWKTTGEWFKKGIEAGYLSGDLFYLAHCAANCTVWDPTLSLPASLEGQQKYLKVVKETNYSDAYDTAVMNLQVTKNLMGLTEDYLSMNDESFNERECLEKMTERKYLSGIGMYHNHKAQLFLCYEQYEKAYEEVKKADKYIKSQISLIYLTRLCTVAFFSCSGYLLYKSNSPKDELKNRMRKELSRMKKLSNHNPVNFQHLQYLMEAELANVENRTADAARLYGKAIASAKQNEWLADEAYANELAAKFYYYKYGIKASVGYWNEAFNLISEWGAINKKRFLTEKYPELSTLLATVNTRIISLDTTNEDESSQSLDIASIVKYSQAISGEIELMSLLTKMMHIIMLNAGAENGLLLLEQDSELFIQAAATANEITTMQHIPATESDQLPHSLVNYVSNLKVAVVLDDASKQGEFTNDEYILSHRPKSVLCSPIVFLNKLYGIIYLENNVSVGAFSEDRLRILNLLTSQMAISIQNALLYTNLEEKVQERTAELRLEKKKTDDMLYNILPEQIANELKRNGHSEARQFESTTVLFTDFVNFTKISEALTPKELVAEVHLYFTAFDAIIERYGLEKIKTIGDAYLAVSGIPNEDKNHALNAITAAIDILNFVKQRKAEGGLFDIRIGLHSGAVVAGIVGVKKFVYDIWGDTVNTAARMETNSEPGKINASATTYELVKANFRFTYRGMIDAKNKGMIEMYFVEGKI
jgi:predicted ATPase/class 3 adenylate cyclase/tRNA A-37 threonylcarbamoyl transferase component Bud32